ncbi:MAG: hypothetical protein M3383_06580 [Actinomycetota bacterium]|nr:hypothetical protein [Actinomycetota bacterium]
MPIPRSLLGRITALAGGALVLLLVLAQIFVPGLGEDAIEDRLTENGGVADVSLKATPAVRLLWGSGDAVEVSGSGLDLDLDLEEDPRAFEDLDRFDDAQIVITDSDAGPVQIDNFTLTQDGDDPYLLAMRGATSLSAIAEFAAGNAEVPGSGIIGTVLDFTGVGGADLDIDMDMKLVSDDGRVRVIEGGGEIAGVPTGPLAEVITAAIVLRL